MCACEQTHRFLCTAVSVASAFFVAGRFEAWTRVEKLQGNNEDI